ncbi:MAG: gliding motility-associated C-terminal domain-containing protein [Bacteroidia bacterium]
MHALLPLFNRVFMLVCCYMLTSFSCYSQNWLRGEGGVTNDEALDVASDSSGNYYVAGYFTSGATFGNTVLNSSGNSDIFIAKYNASGTVLWAVKAGGPGADRAYSIKADNAGNVYVTGYYYGTANFGSNSITSVAGTQDVFIAKYDTAGTVQWIKSIGGSDAETGYGITCDHAGNVIVTGQFRGTATFGSTSLTSVIDPLTSLPSFDIFTVKYTAAGTFSWVEQGSAKYDDRGLDVAVDLSNNIYVVGQFSDTIQFDVVHNNPVSNCGYLMKYDANGNEQWLIKMSAAQTIVYSIVADPSNNILITGDFKGTLSIHTNPIVSSSSAFSNKVFIAKFSNSGSVLWVENDGSDSDVTSKSIAVDNAGNAYISGLFKCRFDEYSQTLGTGIFYSSGFRDVFVTKYSSAGARQWIRHFGSNKDDYCSGIAVKIIDKPVITGSFENWFNIPQSNSFTIFPENINSGSGGPGYCGYSNYQNWVSQQTSGQKDIFITSPVDMGQTPFDYFQRSGNCTLDLKMPCIANCQSNINSCGPLITGSNLFQIDTQFYGARFDFQWNTGNTDDTIHIASSGLYKVITTREDGCFEKEDSVMVAIHPIPSSPWITDSYSINISQPPSTTPLKICGRDSITLWGTHAINSSTVFWQGPTHAVVNDSTIKINKMGWYTFNVVGPGSCSSANNIEVVMDTFALHDILEPHIVFSDPVLQTTDTISICQGEQIGVKVIDSAFYSINGNEIPFKTVKWHISPGSIGTTSTYTSHNITFSVSSTGLYTITDTLFNYCGDSVIYPISRSFYVIVNAKPNILLSINGPYNGCPGDSVTLTATSNVYPFIWTNGTITGSYTDTMQVVVPSGQPVRYAISATYTDTITGCSNSEQMDFYLSARPFPVVTISPNDGIVCPNDSVLLTCEPGINYYWISPEGDSIGTTQSIYVDVPGFYHCIHTATDGCIQTSNFVEAKEYNTPYLVAAPGNFICENESIVISAQASNAAIIQWLSPLTGSDISKTISSPGVYKCEITDCGITTIDSVVITQSIPLAVISSIDTIMCPGDTLLLNGNAGMDSYEWISENSSDPFLYITSPGTYTLKTGDVYGCHTTSAPYVVGSLPQAVAPTTADTSICAGQSISIGVTSPGPIAWYNSQLGGTPIHLGNTYVTPVISNNTTYYVRTLDSVCGSAIVPLNVTIHNSSLYPSFSGDTVLCTGEMLAFTSSIIGVDYIWTSPGGLLDSLSSINIPSVSETHEGYYTLQYSDSFCTGPIDSFYVMVNPVPVPHIFSDSVIYICLGNTIVLTVDTTYSSYSWSPGGETTQAIAIDSAATYKVTVTQNECTGISNSILVALNPPLPEPIAPDTNVCQGNAVTLIASSIGVLTWYNASIVQVGTGSNLVVTSVDSSTFYYVKSTDSAGCTSDLKQVNVTVIQTPDTPVIYVVPPFCAGNDIQFSTDSLPNADYSWSGPNGFSSSLTSPMLLSVQVADSGWYYLSYNLQNNNVFCQSPVDSIHIAVNELPSPHISADSLIYLCAATSIELSVDSLFPSYSWFPGGDTSQSTLIDSAGVYYVAVSQNGCLGTSNTITVILKQPLQAPLAADVNVCSGNSATLTASGSDIIAWYDSLMNMLDTGFVFTTSAIDSNSYYFVGNTDSAGCSSPVIQVNISIVEDSVPPLIFNTSPVCVGDSIYFLTDSLTGATYNWSGPVGFSSSLQYPFIAVSDISHNGQYQLIVNLNGCILPTATTSVLVNAIPTIPSFAVNPYYCEEDSLYLQVSLNPGDSIQWLSPGNSIISDTSFVSIASLSLSNNGTYQLTINSTGCSNDTSFAITVNEKPEAAIYSNSPVCSGDTLLIYTNPNTGIVFSWNGPNGFTSSNPSFSIPGVNTENGGIYALLPSKNGCVGDTTTALISVYEMPVIELGNDTAFCNNTSVTFVLPSAYSYLWNDGSTNNTFTASDSGRYTVIATSGPGCSDTDSILIDNYNCVLKDAANIMSPNGDGVNDYFYFNTEGMREVEVFIYDRWGVLIYTYTDLNGYWNGINQRNNKIVSDGVYFYVAKVTTYDFTNHSIKGFIHVYN